MYIWHFPSHVISSDSSCACMQLWSFMKIRCTVLQPYVLSQEKSVSVSWRLEGVEKNENIYSYSGKCLIFSSINSSRWTSSCKCVTSHSFVYIWFLCFVNLFVGFLPSPTSQSFIQHVVLECATKSQTLSKSREDSCSH